MKLSVAATLPLALGSVLVASAQSSAVSASPSCPSKVAVVAFQMAVLQTNEGQRDFADLRKKNGQDLNSDSAKKALQDMYTALATKVYDAMRAYAKERGYSLVVDVSQQQNPVLYADESCNITKAVIDAYNLKSGVAAPPAQPAASPSGQIAANPESTGASDASGFVPFPGDIECTLASPIFAGREGSGWGLDSVAGVSCSISGKGQQGKKEVALKSTKVQDGMLETRDFGPLKITTAGMAPNVELSIAIRGDELQPFREFLLKP